MEETRYRLLREGYLDIKPPPDSPERILHKAWRRLWVRAIIFLPQGRGEPHFILQLCRRPQDDVPLKQVKASRDGLRLFRCRSGSRALQCWGVASGSTLLLYLAADTEQLTQEWMHTLREGLWPTMSTNQDYSHDISLIDDEKSFSSGLLGVYGRLVKTSEMTLSIIHPHWQGTQMRWRLADILAVKIVRRVEDSHSGVFSLTVQNSSTKDTRVLQFYSTTAIKTVDWLKSILPNIEQDEDKSKYVNNLEIITQGTKTLEKTNLLIPVEATSNYATVKKTKAHVNSQDCAKTEENSVASDVFGEAAEILENIPIIPDAFLNASTSSLMLEISENSGHASDGDASDNSSSGSFDHIYEDLEMVKDRSYTVYEKVDDDDDVYVPHVPSEPPTLPERTEQRIGFKEDIVPQKVGHPTQTPNQQVFNDLSPAALRLQRLCNSVSEALKQAEEPKPVPVVPKRPSLLRKMVGKSKSKSHRVTPPLDMQTNNTSTIKRTVSESDLTGTKLENTDLPFKPFESPGSTGGGTNNRQNPNKSKGQNHVPLEDLLKNLKTGGHQQHQQHRRGVSEGGKIVYDIHQYTKHLQVRSKNEKITPSTENLDPQEGEYIDMY